MGHPSEKDLSEKKRLTIKKKGKEEVRHFPEKSTSEWASVLKSKKDFRQREERGLWRLFVRKGTEPSHRRRGSILIDARDGWEIAGKKNTLEK